MNFWYCFIFLGGLIFGSFFNVCIFRLPERRFFKKAFSVCRYCEKRLPFWANIPLLSFLFLKGKSHCCNKNISLQYPLVELVSGLIFLFLFYKFNFLEIKDFNLVIDYDLLRRFLHAAIFSSVLMIGSVIDLRLMIIPNVLTVGLVFSAPLAVFLHPHLSWQSSLIGAFLGGTVIWTIAQAYFLYRKREGIGMGDAKLLAGIGAWLGYQALLPTLMFGSLLGSVFGLLFLIITRTKNLQLALPFGPFLSLGALIYLLSPYPWQEIILSIRSLFS